jgi:glycine/D-amino acid oxidase-like deaminating enzyme
MHSLDRTAYPAPYKHPDFRGQLYQLDEPVLDTQSLISTLATKTQTDSYLLNTATPRIQRKATYWQIHLPEGQQLHSRTLILTAGSGNAALLEHLGRNTPQMQRRPLHMLMLQGKLPAIYAHHLTGGTTPALTITSSPQSDNTQTWYIGGTIAEQGTQRNSADQIQAGRQALAKALPWIDLQHTHWASLAIERAEPKTAHGQRPNDSYLHQADGIFTAWPTKLTLAPRLAEQILKQLPAPADYPTPTTLQLPRPPLAQPPWHTQWKTAH